MRLQIGEEKEHHLIDIDGFVRVRNLTGRDLGPGESVNITIGRYEDGQLYVVQPPLVIWDPNMTVSIRCKEDGHADPVE